MDGMREEGNTNRRIERKVKILAKVELLSGLTRQELYEIAGDFRWEEYVKGTYIFQQDLEAHGFYVLVEGRADAFIKRQGREMIRLSSFGPGDAFGEVDLFTGKLASASVQCTEDCRVLALSAERFAYMLVRWPKLYAGFVTSLSQRLNLLNRELWEEGYRNFLRSGLQFQLKYRFYEYWGSPYSLREIEEKLGKLSETEENVLFLGERGTGKTLVAWLLHKKQYGENAPFIIVDGRHMDQQWGDILFETRQIPGNPEGAKSYCILKVAESGTLFIKDINMLSSRAQLKLAEVLSSRCAPCRIVATLQAEPEDLSVKLLPELKKFFTEEYRFLSLRERKRDIPVISARLLKKLADQHGRPAPMIDREATKMLLNHNFRQTNIAELIQIVERAFLIADGDVIGVEHLFFGPTGERIGRSFNLLMWKRFHSWVKEGLFPRRLQKTTFTIMILTVVALLFIPGEKSGDFGLTLVWGLWWPAIVISAFWIGRVWCGACPVSLAMEMIQKVYHLNRPVPNVLKKYDYLITTFLFVLVFWIEEMTDMRHNRLYGGLWLFTITSAAAVTGIIFTRHTWCRHLCPLGGLIGMASISGMVEVRADSEICLNKCTTHECYRGTGEVEGCPMSQHSAFLDSNQACKLCFRCVRNCPNDAVKVNLRVPAREVWHLVRVNQGFALFIGVALGILAPILYFGPLHGVWPEDRWRFWFSVTYWGTAVLTGLITWFIARPFREKAAPRRIKLVFAFIPVVIAGLIAYQLHFLPGAKSVLIGLGYIPRMGADGVFYIPLLRAGQAGAAFMGVLLTGFTIVMVLLRTGKLKNRRTSGGN